MTYFSNLPAELHLLISSFIKLQSIKNIDLSHYFSEIYSDNSLWYYFIIHDFPFFTDISKSKTIQSYNFKNMKDIYTFLTTTIDNYGAKQLNKFFILQICKFISNIIDFGEFYILDYIINLETWKRSKYNYNYIDYSNIYFDFSVKYIMKNYNISGLKYYINSDYNVDEPFIIYLIEPNIQYYLTKYASGGYIDCLIYLHENGCPWNHYATENAAKCGHLDCLKYLHENGCTWDKYAIESASQNGHLDCLKYLHESGCPWDKYATRETSKNGHLDCLKYLHENGCPWDEYATRNASQNGHFDCLKYLGENGCPDSLNLDIRMDFIRKFIESNMSEIKK